MVKQTNAFAFLKHNELFKGFTDQEITALLPLIDIQTYEKGALIFEEGKEGKELYLIQSGKVEVVKGKQQSCSLAVLHAGEWFGEMPLFDVAERSASVRALEKSQLLILPFEKLESLFQKTPLYSKMIVSLTKKANQRLKKMNELALSSLKEELRLTKAHDHMGQFIVHVFILLTFYFYTVKLFDQYGEDSFLKRTIASLLIICFGLSAIVFVKKSEYPLSFYGVTLKKWRTNAYEGFLFTLPVLIFMLLLKWALISSLAVFKNLSLFAFGPPENTHFYFFHTAGDKVTFFLYIAIYVLLVPVQEFLARGCLQSGLQNFFRSPNHVFLAILTSNLLFGMFHGLKTFTFAIAAFLLGIFWGWIYARQRSIVGPSVSHALVGAWAFGCLDYTSILIY